MIDPHGEYSAAFKGCGELFNVDNLQLPYWLMNFEEHCEVFLTTAGRRARSATPTFSPSACSPRAPRARISRQHRQGHGRFADPLPADRPQRDPGQRNGQARPRRRHAAVPCGSRTSSTSSAPTRATPSCSRACWSSDSMGGFIAKLFRLPSHGRPISIVDVSGVPSEITSVVVSVLARMVFDYAIWSRTEAQRPLLLVCEEAHRYVPKDENVAARRCARSSSGSPRKAANTASPRPDHAAPVRPCRRRAVAVRHDHLHASEQRPRPGLRPGRDARRRARLPRRHPGAAQPRMHRLRRRRRHPDPGARSTISSPRSARPRPTRASPLCGARPATKKASSSAPSSAGAGTAAKS